MVTTVLAVLTASLVQEYNKPSRNDTKVTRKAHDKLMIKVNSKEILKLHTQWEEKLRLLDSVDAIDEDKWFKL